MKEVADINKRDIRKGVLLARDALTALEQEGAGEALAKRIGAHPWFDMSDIILAFVSYGSEIDTKGIIREALTLGKKVFVPRVEGESMQFYRIKGMEELMEGYKGILEPSGESERYLYQEDETGRTLLLMPGAVFDRKRNRIGYGKGYYDKFLADKPLLQLRTIGVCHKVQMLEAIPSEPWDIKPCEVIDI